MKKIYLSILVCGMMMSTVVFGQTDRQISPDKRTSAQKQMALANLQNANTVTSVSKVVLACDSLEVDSVAGNGYNGNMFDIAVTASTTIETFSVSVDAGTWNVAIFYKTGTFVGSETSSTGWIFLDSANVVSTTTGIAGAYYKVPVNLSLGLTAGTYAFYVTTTSASATMNYTNGTAVGNTFSSNANFAVKEGNGGAYPFNVINTPRVFNGMVHYCNGIVGIQENASLPSVELYPNPTSQSVSLDLTAYNGKQVNISIMNTLGQRLQSNVIVANGVETLNVQGYAAGMYFVQLEMNGKITTSKLSIK